jgi:hypothetical protein
VKSIVFRQWTIRVIVMAASFGIALMFGEFILRVSGLAKIPEEPRSPYPRSYFVRSEDGGFDIAERFPNAEFHLLDYSRLSNQPFEVWSNELGCFDKPLESGHGFILLVGDSFTWGYVPFDATWGRIVEREVDIRVAKCGVTAYGPILERMKVEKVARRIGRPAVIVVGYFIGNDLEDDYLFPRMTISDGYLATRSSMSNEATGARHVHTDSEIQAAAQSVLQKPQGLDLVKRFVVRHSVTYNLLRNNVFLRKAMSQIGLAEPPPESPVPLVFRPASRYPWLELAWESHLNNLRELQFLAQKLGAQLLVVVIPTREQVYEFLRPRSPDAEWELPNERLRTFFKAEQIHSLDLLKEFRARACQVPKRELDLTRDLYWPVDPHFNLTGNRLAGLLVSRYLLDQRLVDPPDRKERLSRIVQELKAAADPAMAKACPSK